jgi:hypothetical protein
MAYSDFDLKTAVETFSLVEERNLDLFKAIEPVTPSPILSGLLDEFTPIALAINTEKARSEFLIAPILVEVKRRSTPPVNVLPGVALDVDRSRGLTGYCDYLIARSDEIFYLVRPLVAIVETKREDLIAGLGQCVAEMVAIRLFNEREQSPAPAAYGCVTSGNVWRFLKLEGPKILIDRPEYHLGDVGKLLGILIHIAAG